MVHDHLAAYHKDVVVIEHIYDKLLRLESQLLLLCNTYSCIFFRLESHECFSLIIRYVWLALIANRRQSYDSFLNRNDMCGAF